MKRLYLAVSVIAGVVLVAILVSSMRNNNPSKETPERAKEANLPIDDRPRASKVVPKVPNVASNKDLSGVADAFHHSHNYLDFVRSVFGAANSGDPNAQYYVGKALAFCDATHRMYFQKKGQPLTLDEALVNAAQMHRSNEFTQSIYDRCHDLENFGTSQFGSAEAWIDKASEAGQPVAQVTVALNALSRNAMEASMHAAGINPPSGSVKETPVDPQELLLEAVQSSDPEALWAIGVAEGQLTQNYDDKIKNQLAWWLVSCQRGLDCGSEADWVQLDCPDDTYCTPGITGTDYIRNAAAGSWPEVEQRAQDINTKLSSQQWSALGIGS